VVAGNCGVSLAPLVLGKRVAPPPLDLIGDTGWYQIRLLFGIREDAGSEPGRHQRRPAGRTYDPAGRKPWPVWIVPPRRQEIGAMKKLVDEALAAGAIGVSTGLYYEPARAAAHEEVIEVCRPLSARKGLYCTHMRDEGDRVTDSLEETFRIGRELRRAGGGVAPQGGRGEKPRPFERNAAADRRTHEIAGHRPGLLSLLRLLDHPVRRPRGDRHQDAGYLVEAAPGICGHGLAVIAEKMNLSIEQTVRKLIPAGAIYFMMDEPTCSAVLAFEHTMVGSDGLPHDTAPHPRLWGTFRGCSATTRAGSACFRSRPRSTR